MKLEEYVGTRLEINLDNLKHNIRSVRNYIKENTMIMAVIKANAYGHGSVEVAETFLENGADKLGVSLISEAIELRQAKIRAPILILNYTAHNQYSKLIKYNLNPSIYRYEDARLLSDLALKMKAKVEIHIKVDTGMGRIGFLPNQEALEDIIKISKLPCIKIQGIYSHFSAADEREKEISKVQFKKFKWLLDEVEKHNIKIPIKHISNSAGIINLPEYNLDMVRAGIILYGYYPSEKMNNGQISLKPAMALKTNVSNIKTLPGGVGIGYNQFFSTAKESNIATLPVGYGDGYYRLLTGKGEVCINGNRVPIVGKICMDQMMVDVSSLDLVNMEEEVVLFGYEKEAYPKVEELSKLIDTSYYELISLIARRVPRIYIKNGLYSHIINYILD